MNLLALLIVLWLTCVLLTILLIIYVQKYYVEKKRHSETQDLLQQALDKLTKKTFRNDGTWK